MITEPLTEHVSGLGLCRQERLADAVDVLSHDPDDVVTTLDQLRHLRKQRNVSTEESSFRL